MFRFIFLVLCFCVYVTFADKVDCDQRRKNCILRVIPTRNHRMSIFNLAISNYSSLPETNSSSASKEFCISARAVVKLWFLLPVAENIDLLVDEVIAEVTGNKSNSQNLDYNDASTIAVLNNLELKIKSNPELYEQFIDAKTAVETEIASGTSKLSENREKQFHRFIVLEQFLFQAKERWILQCDANEYNQFILARAIIQVSNKPDQRPDIVKLFDDALDETATTGRIEVNNRLVSENCPEMVPNSITKHLFDILIRKINNESVLKTEVETEKSKLINSKAGLPG